MDVGFTSDLIKFPPFVLPRKILMQNLYLTKKKYTSLTIALKLFLKHKSENVIYFPIFGKPVLPFTKSMIYGGKKNQYDF